jgi:hypothetical protein
VNADSGREEVPWIDAEMVRQALERTQGEVSLPSLDTTHVRAVHTEEVGERFLRQTPCQPMPPEVPPNRLLQVAFH